MLAELLPPAASVAEAFDDETPSPLYPEEAALVERAVDKRRREFATARRCAREALATLGVPAAALPSGKNREPLWPPGIVGSITHCQGYRAAAVARQHDLASVGIDAEPHAPLPSGVLEVIALPREVTRLAELSAGYQGRCWDRLLFCAKESVYKAWFPLARRWLGFHEADIVIDPGSGTFSATLLVLGPQQGETTLGEFTGRFLVSNGLVLTAVAVPGH
ncbi:MAG TPA: 4'-phosphopantetheinyl transferase superfamily protein [Streptosporangiaceae bacterium]